jgi:hypothetical protein
MSTNVFEFEKKGYVLWTGFVVRRFVATNTYPALFTFALLLWLRMILLPAKARETMTTTTMMLLSNFQQ